MELDLGGLLPTLHSCGTACTSAPACTSHQPPPVHPRKFFVAFLPAGETCRRPSNRHGGKPAAVPSPVIPSFGGRPAAADPSLPPRSLVWGEACCRPHHRCSHVAPWHVCPQPVKTIGCAFQLACQSGGPKRTPVVRHHTSERRHEGVLCTLVPLHPAGRGWAGRVQLRASNAAHPFAAAAAASHPARWTPHAHPSPSVHPTRGHALAGWGRGAAGERHRACRKFYWQRWAATEPHRMWLGPVCETSLGYQAWQRRR